MRGRRPIRRSPGDGAILLDPADAHDPRSRAVALGDKIESLGAYFGYAAVLGLGVLSLLYFAQAREVKRLRDWAGRSPERDADLAQRVQTDAQRRVVAQPLPAAASRPAREPADRRRAAGRRRAQGRRRGRHGEVPAGIGRRRLSSVRPASSIGLRLPRAPPTPAPGSVPGAVPQPAPAAGAPGATATPGAPADVSSPAGAGAAAGAGAGAAAAAAGAAAAARQTGPPARTPPFANGAGGQDTHESAAARPDPLADLPARPRPLPAPSSSSRHDERTRSGSPRSGSSSGGVGGVVVVIVLLVVLLGGGGDKPPASNEIGNLVPPPAASKPPSGRRRRSTARRRRSPCSTGRRRPVSRASIGSKLEQSGFTISKVGDNADQRIATTTIVLCGDQRGGREGRGADRRTCRAAAVQPIDANTAAAAPSDAVIVVIVGSDQSSTG